VVSGLSNVENYTSRYKTRSEDPITINIADSEDEILMLHPSD
jgi:hypothetical protein